MRSALLLALLLCACSNPNDVRQSREIGWIDVRGEMGYRYTVVQAPASARAGVPFQVEVVTFGSSGCTREDGAEVSVAGLVAEVTPYDIFSLGVPCTPDIHSFPRAATVRFSSAGSATIRVIGRTGDGPVRYEVPITVTP